MKPVTLIYVILKRREVAGLRMISERTNDGGRAVFAFDDPVRAEAFLILENLTQELGPGWEVIDHTPLDAATCSRPALPKMLDTS